MMPDFASLWGGQGFGGVGNFGMPPPPAGLINQQPADLAQTLLNAPSTPGQPGQTTPLSPLRTAFAGNVSGLGPNMWDQLMNTVGNPGAGGFKMPGTTIGAPAGAPGMAAQLPPQMVVPGQAAPPPGIPYFHQQQPATWGGGGNQGLMQQYLALQQMMRGA